MTDPSPNPPTLPVCLGGGLGFGGPGRESRPGRGGRGPGSLGLG